MAVKVQNIILPSSDPTLPPLLLQVIELVDTYMLWIGISSKNETGKEEKATPEGNLCRDWACAMPPRNTATPLAATSLFRSSSSDVAISMAQRLVLAKRFRKQIFLSVDLPLSLGQVVLDAEKGIMETLNKIENI